MAQRTERPRRRPASALAVQPKSYAGRNIAIVISAMVIIGLVMVHAQAKGTTDQSAASSPVSLPTTKSVANTDDARLTALITNWQHNYSFKSSVYVQELTGTKRSASQNAETSAVTASTYKVFVAYAVLHGVQVGQYRLTTITGDGNSIQTDLSNMILNSDNTAARTLGFMVGWKNINTLLQAHGITHTQMYNYVPPSTAPVGDKFTTAADLGSFLQQLYAGKLLNSNYSSQLIGLLQNQNYRNFIAAGVPTGVATADKPGWLRTTEGDTENIENDAAIVYGPKSTYILVILTSGTSTQPIANLSRQIYQELQG